MTQPSPDTLEREKAGLDDLLPLKVACERVFGDTCTIATLRAEADRGRLTVFRVGRRDYTTIRHIRKMVEQCRRAPKAPGSTWTRDADNGSSETERASIARDALSLTVAKLKKSSGTTSPQSTDRRRARHQG